jgi:chemotaxis signal transduction protein
MASNEQQDEAGRVPSEPAEPPAFLLFEVGGREYSIEVGATEGVVDCPTVCPLPAPPDGVIGVASVRGRMTVVFDLSRESGASNNRRRLVLIKGDARLGLLTDRVYGVVLPGPRGLFSNKDAKEWPTKAVFEYGKRRIGVLDVDRLLEK